MCAHKPLRVLATKLLLGMPLVISLQKTSVNLRFSILNSPTSSDPEYRETKDLKTNEFGLVTHFVGKGKADNGIFSDVDWGSSSKFLNIEVSISNGPYSDLGTVQFMSVPYALESKHAAMAMLADTAITAYSTEKNASVGGSTVVNLAHSGIGELNINIPEVPSSWVGQTNHIAYVVSSDAKEAVCLMARLTSTTNLNCRIENRSGSSGNIRLNYIILPY